MREAGLSGKPHGASTRTALLAGAGVALVFGAAFLFAAVIAPVLHTRKVVTRWAGRIGDEDVLKKLGGRKHAVRRLGVYLRLPDWAAPEKARVFSLLARCKGEGVPLLLETLRREDPALRSGAARALGRIYYSSPARRGCFGYLGSPPPPPKKELLRGEVQRALEVALGDDDVKARVSAAWAFCVMRGEARKVVPIFIRALGEEDKELVNLAESGFVYLGPASVDLLDRALDHGDVRVRRRAIGVLERVAGYWRDSPWRWREFDNDCVAGALAEALDDEDVQVRRLAAGALWSLMSSLRFGRTGLMDEWTVEQLVRAQLDTDAEVRTVTAETVVECGWDTLEELVWVVEEAEELVAPASEFRDLRNAALSLLQAVIEKKDVARCFRYEDDGLTEFGLRAACALASLLEEEPGPIRALAARLLGEVCAGSETNVPVLREAAADEDWEVRVAAAEALTRIYGRP